MLPMSEKTQKGGYIGVPRSVKGSRERTFTMGLWNVQARHDSHGRAGRDMPSPTSGRHLMATRALRQDRLIFGMARNVRIQSLVCAQPDFILRFVR